MTGLDCGPYTITIGVEWMAQRTKNIRDIGLRLMLLTSLGEAIWSHKILCTRAKEVW